jgi:excisionase family DNA binding protein
MKQATPRPLLKVAEAAALINCATETIYREIREKNLSHFRVGSDIRLDASEVLEHFKRAACDGR